VTAMDEVAPTLARVAGPMLGARLISLAGGLEALALVPSGTVQTLGAENALFRHLKDGSPPPKHGTIFQHEAVNRAPWWQRGKISRALSGKISIAAKSDAFGGPPERGAELLADFERRLDAIRKQYPRPPVRQAYGRGGPRSSPPRGRPRPGGTRGGGPPSRGERSRPPQGGERSRPPQGGERGRPADGGSNREGPRGRGRGASR